MPQIPSEAFGAVIDKGTLDAILCGSSSFDHTTNTLLECHRCSAFRSARLPVNLIGSPVNHANRLFESSITSQSTGLVLL